MTQRMHADEFRPRIIVWALAGIHKSDGFSTHECLLTIDSIARLAKPIIVFTGSNLLHRPDLYQVIEYGTALGLKIIVEARVEELTNHVLSRYKAFGPKLFRLILDGCVIEDSETRYKQSPEFRALQDAIQRLKEVGYEIHLGVTIKDVSIRQLAFYHDFAFRSAANGLYCHLSFEPSGSDITENKDVHEVIEALARMKRFSPKTMYVSPQCVKYGPRILPSDRDDDQHNACVDDEEWNHWCLSGKTYAFITSEGKVQVCSSQRQVCGDLRSNGYNFKNIWETSEVFSCLREQERTCRKTQERLRIVEAAQPVDREV